MMWNDNTNLTQDCYVFSLMSQIYTYSSNNKWKERERKVSTSCLLLRRRGRRRGDGRCCCFWNKRDINVTRDVVYLVVWNKCDIMHDVSMYGDKNDKIKEYFIKMIWVYKYFIYKYIEPMKRTERNAYSILKINKYIYI